MKLKENQKIIVNEKIAIAQQQAIDNGSHWTVYADKMMQEILSNVKITASEASREQYRKLCKSSISKLTDDSLNAALMHCRTRASFDKTRTAFRFCIVEKIQQLYKESDKARQKKDFDKRNKLFADAFKMAIKFEDEFLSENKIVFSDVSGQKDFKRVSFSKKKNLKKAASAEDIIKSFSTNGNVYDRYALAFSVIATFGIRPDELQKGIKLSVENGVIYGVVKGSKVDINKGQKVRAMGSAFREDNICDQILINAINNNGGEVVITQNKKEYEALRKYLNRHHKGTSLYTFRHKVASDLKASGVSKSEIAAFLGHRTTDSQQFYGYARSGRGGRDFKAKGSDEVRIKPDIKDYLKPVTKPVTAPLGSKIRQVKSSMTTTPKAPKFKPPGIK